MAGGKLQLVNLIRKTYSSLSWREAIGILYEVRRRNGGKLVGLRISKFLLILSRILYDYENWNDKTISTKIGKGYSNLTCFICYKLFATQFSRNRHVKIAHSKTLVMKKKAPSKIQCSFCSKSYSYEQSLKRHIEIHHNLQVREITESKDKTSNFQCSYCSKGFIYEATLNFHIFRKHNPEMRKCDECNETFTRTDSLWRHRRNVHNKFNINIDLMTENGDELMQCDTCKAEFVDKNKFIIHLSRKACFYKLTEDEKFLCEKCPKSYFHKSDLNRHVKNKHSTL